MQLKNVPDSEHARRFLLADGDLLISRANTRDLVGMVGRYASDGVPCIYPDLMMRLFPDERRCSGAYLEIVLRSSTVRSEIHAGARGTSDSMVKISASFVEDIEIPLPTLEEQHRIVAAHAAFERRIGVLERALAKLRVVEGTSVASALGTSRRVPLGAWLAGIESGKSPLAEDAPAGEGEWGVLKVSAVQAGWFDRTENKVLRDPQLVDQRYEVRPGDLLMTRANTEELVGLACVANDPGPRLLLSDKTLRLVPDKSAAVPEFIALALASLGVRRQIQTAATGSSASMKNISQAAIRELLVPDVPLEGQRQTVAGVAAIQRRIRAHIRQISKLRTVQQAVAEDLLAGRGRAAAA
ncbi:restriction endonuclease subunit S [Streptomyces sp. Y2F8-2]|uniref:restriction endonuclease subunit S n=1 Tax=Streptomyces sp. Y2F8-2 TaxID=2759675 RepID=UPI00190603CD|nr:restriction endonuclease subunit S [Streptomyces sp. Y2F8-2]